MNKYFFILLILGIGCTQDRTNQKDQKDEINPPKIALDAAQANHLIQLPLKCVSQEFPNKLSQVLTGEKDLGTPKQLHPAFFGCFDWHSAVHGHWVLVKLAKDFPTLENREKAIKHLKNAISKENIEAEIAFFNRPQDYSFERTYGWVWLLKLQLELETWDSEIGKGLAANLRPLSDLIIEKYTKFLPKLNYALRVGTHSNTAFGLVSAYDYAKHTENQAFLDLIDTTAKKLFLEDKNYPLSWEPNGTDFLSPCFEEIDLMRRVLEEKEFNDWCHQFLPVLYTKDFDLKVAVVSDRTDGHLVHLDGLNFSRAWVFYGLVNQYPKEFSHLKKVADKHLNAALPQIVDGNYEGEHWLASFALYALSEKR